jgi:hypothetical protein
VITNFGVLVTPTAGASAEKFVGLSIPQKQFEVLPIAAFRRGHGEIIFHFLFRHFCVVNSLDFLT